MERAFSGLLSASPYYVLGVVLAVSISVFLLRLYVVRKRTFELQRQGLAMPPFHAIFGHLIILARIMSRLPKDAHPHYLPDQLRRAYPDMGPIFYVDAWPIASFMLVVASPLTLAQITTEHTLPKFPTIRDFLYPLTYGRDIVSMDGQEWKTWRSIFNPGFSASHLMTLVPDIVKETRIFCEILHGHAQEETIFPMKSMTDNLAMDVIGQVVLGSSFGSQQASNLLVNALRRQMRWMIFGGEGNPFRRLHPLRPFILAYNAWQMNKYLSPEVDARFSIHQNNANTANMKRSKSVIDLALTAYLKGGAGNSQARGMDSTFRLLAMSQVKLFLFSGHDTTSSSICYIFYLLSIHPSVLSRVRAEHDQVFGTDPNQATARMTSDAFLLYKLPYTVAVIKESTRLFPAASTTRSGEPGFNITDAVGRDYPTDKCLVWLISHAIQRDPAYWPQPDRFLPERWLAPPGDALHPVKGAWRPFEHGPRACIGKELSMIEMKIVMVLVAREFDIDVVYEQLDKVAVAKGTRTVDGERAYQLGMGQPSGNLPCKVRKRAGF